MNSWYELEAIASSIVLTNETDALIWQYNASRTYTTSCLYAIINYMGVTPVFIPAVWKLVVPPGIHIFLWLVAYNKVMTRDNLLKRNMQKTLNCVFCSEHESVQHLFCECVVALQVWKEI